MTKTWKNCTSFIDWLHITDVLTGFFRFWARRNADLSLLVCIQKFVNALPRPTVFTHILSMQKHPKGIISFNLYINIYTYLQNILQIYHSRLLHLSILHLHLLSHATSNPLHLHLLVAHFPLHAQDTFCNFTCVLDSR